LLHGEPPMRFFLIGLVLSLAANKNQFTSGAEATYILLGLSKGIFIPDCMGIKKHPAQGLRRVPAPVHGIAATPVHWAGHETPGVPRHGASGSRSRCAPADARLRCHHSLH